jgi:dihydroorotate dehydrogenase subfamily 1
MLKFAGVEFKNPIVVASSPLTKNIDLLKQAEEAGAAAVSTKLTFIKQPFYGKLRMYDDLKVGSIVCHDLRLDMEEGIRLVEQAKKQTKLVVFCNLTHKGDDINGWATMAKAHEEAGADIVELNMICPNISLTAKRLGQNISSSGALVGQDPQMAGEVMSLVKNAVKIPVIAKLTPNVTDISEIAAALEAAGADGICIAGGQMSLPPVNLEDPTHPYPLMEGASFGSLGGPSARLMDYALTALIAQRVKIPVIGGGGIEKWNHCVDFMMWGATLVTACTSLMWHGFPLITKWIEGMDKYMSEHGYKGYEDMVGLALPSLRGAHELAAAEGSAVVDAENCTGCEVCLRPGHCSAIWMVDDKAVIDPKKCLGCAICAAMCPKKAITMERVT